MAKVLQIMAWEDPPIVLVQLLNQKVRTMIGMIMMLPIVFIVSLEKPALTSSYS